MKKGADLRDNRADSFYAKDDRNLSGKRRSSGLRGERSKTACIMVEPSVSAQAAGLRYVTDSEPGIRRRRSGRGFSYVDIIGVRISDRSTLERIKLLAIPPAWTDVWICPIPEGHLQVTGRDAKKRKQYIYHPEWRRVRDQTKFDRMISFGGSLPLIRERVEHDLALPGLSRERVLATVVRLLETTLIRIGNKEYLQENGSFGLTTLREDHLDLFGSTIVFQFKGKSGKEHRVKVHDKRLAKVIKRCLDIPGHELFRYIDEEGDIHTVDSSDVNAYLQEITGDPFTAKDFRTWGGTMHAAMALMEIGRHESETQAKKNLAQAVKQVAQHLGNKPAICRNYYIHPAIVEAYMEGKLPPELDGQEESQSDASPFRLRSGEKAVLALLNEFDREKGT